MSKAAEPPSANEEPPFWKDKERTFVDKEATPWKGASETVDSESEEEIVDIESNGRYNGGLTIDICGDTLASGSNTDIMQRLLQLEKEVKEATRNLEIASVTGRKNRTSTQGLQERVLELENRMNEVEGETPGSDDKEMNRFPRDCYSLLALNGPDERGWPVKKIVFFSVALFMFILQIFFFYLIFESKQMSAGTYISPATNPFIPEKQISWIAGFVPPRDCIFVEISKYLSLIVYPMFPDSSVEDIVKALQYFPGKRAIIDAQQSFRRNRAVGGYPVWCMMISCILRAIQGLFASFTVFIVVSTSDDILDIILNFTALNFISSLDESFFSLARSGVFGTDLKEETCRIEGAKLPAGIAKNERHVCYRIVMCFVSVLLFSMMLYASFCEVVSSKVPVTQLRVEFKQFEFESYSGCYKKIDLKSETYYINDNGSVTSIGYCSKKERWVLFEGDYTTLESPCEAKTENGLIGFSSRKNHKNKIDALTSFEEQKWFTASGAPLELFIVYGENSDLHCELTLGDGRCDAVFNNRGYQFDSGDCCAATCVGTKCGRDGITNAFGSNITMNGFECENPVMKPITIQLTSIKSSRSEEFVEFVPSGENETVWRSEEPERPYFSLECDGKSVITVHIHNSMEFGDQTVHVEDGANCTVLAKNTDDPLENPVWFFNYTIFHGESIGKGLEILNGSNRLYERIGFKRLPDCYLDELNGLSTSVSTIYSHTLTSSDQAIQWLAADNRNLDYCGNEALRQRFALISLYFAMGKPDHFLNNNDHCSWPIAVCKSGVVTTIKPKNHMHFTNGIPPPEITFLGSLRVLDFTNNQLSSLPPEIGELSNLEHLDLANNRLSVLPREIGNLVNLTELDLANNELSAVPPEIGKLLNLEVLDLSGNLLSSLPTEIGNLLNLRTFHFAGNNFTCDEAQDLLDHIDFNCHPSADDDYVLNTTDSP